jgi:hypothetical protein
MSRRHPKIKILKTIGKIYKQTRVSDSIFLNIALSFSTNFYMNLTEIIVVNFMIFFSLDIDLGF